MYNKTVSLLINSADVLRKDLEVPHILGNNGQIITQEAVESALKTHFDVQPGISKDFAKGIINNLSTVERETLTTLKLRNLQLAKEMNDAEANGSTETLAHLRHRFKLATLEFIRFMIKNNIPLVNEVSSEIGVRNAVHTYSGGLGVLNGDNIKQATDDSVPKMFVTACPQFGYAQQRLDFTNKSQHYTGDDWHPEHNPFLFILGQNDLDLTSPLGESSNALKLTIPGGQIGDIKIKIYVHGVIGKDGWINPVFQYSTYNCNQTGDVERKKQITHELYANGADKLAQQYLLASTALRMTKIFKTGLNNLNEGHAALLPVLMFQEELQKELQKEGISLSFDDRADNNAISRIIAKHGETIKTCFQRVQDKTSMVTHTIDASAFDTYTEQNMREILPREVLNTIFLLCHPESPLKKSKGDFTGFASIYGGGNWGLSMPKVAVYFANFLNAVAKIHETITKQRVFTKPEEVAKTGNVTNAIHSPTWWSKANNLLKGMEAFIPNITKDYFNGFHLLKLKNNPVFQKMVREFHKAEKQETLGFINNLIGNQLGVDSLIEDEQFDKTLTVVSARRAKGYKLNDLPVMDSVVEKYEEIASELKDGEKIVIVFAGKPHPRDAEGRGYVEHIMNKQQEVLHRTNGKVIILYKENYDMNDGQAFAKFDVLLANPTVGWEASGTSPMKNPLRLIMHTFDGFFKELSDVSRSVFGISDISFGFGPKKTENDYHDDSMKNKYAIAFREKFAELTNMYFNNQEEWTKKQIEQLGIFTMCFQMDRFQDSNFTQWVRHFPEFKALLEQNGVTVEDAPPQ